MLERHARVRSYFLVLRNGPLRVPFAATVLGALPIGMLGLGLLLYVAELTGSFADAGLAAAAFGAGNAFGLPLQGRLIDRFGQAVVLAPAGSACCAWTVVLVTAAPCATDARVFAVVVSAGAGACIPATTGAMRVLLAGLPSGSPEAERTRLAGYALLAVLFQLALLAGPLLTSVLLKRAGTGGAVATGGCLAAAAGLLFSATKAARYSRPLRAPAYGMRPRRVRRTGLLPLMSLAGGAGVSTGLVAVAVPAAASAEGSTADSGLMFATVSAGDIAGGLILGARRCRWAYARLLLASLAGSVVAAGILAAAAWFGLSLYPALLLVGAAAGPLAVAGSAVLDEVAPRGRLTSAYSLLVSVGLLGASLGNGAGGALAEAAGHRGLFAVNGCWMLLLLAAGLPMRRALSGGVAGSVRTAAPGPAAQAPAGRDSAEPDSAEPWRR